MQVREAMSHHVQPLAANASVLDAARMMRSLDVGFVPVSDEDAERLKGVITDRDIVVRCTADGRNPEEVNLGEVLSEKPLYCFEDDDLSEAASSMADQQVYRLIVLDNPKSKRLTGVISLADIVRRNQPDLAERAAVAIAGSG